MKRKKDRQRPKSIILRGGAIASLFIVLLYTIFLAARAQSGLGVHWEILLGIAVCVICIIILGLIHALLVLIGRCLPRLFKGEFFKALGSLFKALPIPSSSAIWASIMYVLLLLQLWLGSSFPTAFLFGPFIVIMEALLGGAIAFTISKGFKETRLVKKILVAVQAVLVIIFNIYIVSWLSSQGTDTHLVKYETQVPSHLEKLKAPDPSLPGNFKVETLTYGSGTDIKRPEYGKDVTIQTPPVDTSVILKGYKGFKAKVRTWFWGFDIKKFPLNARVWYPQGQGPFPLVLIVHGNHNMYQYSDPGYAYLGELLASQGFITVSVDENFFNGGFMGGLPAKKSENAARGWLLLQHLKTWETFNETEENIFFGKVDMENIALIGHSRGGEAVCHAASQNNLPRFSDDGNLELNFHFNIKTVIAIAPVDGQYRPSGKPLTLENINYFSIQGSHDPDMSTFHGNRQYQRVTFSGTGFMCKATLYIYRANHGQFNTVWGRTDFSPPGAWFLNLKPLLDQEEQLKISKLYISAFLQVTINKKLEYIPMFKNHRTIIDWLPKTIYVNRYEDSTFEKITDFEEDINPLTGTADGVSLEGENLAVWSEDRLKFRNGGSQGNHVVRLGWNNKEKTKNNKSSTDEDEAQRIEPAKYLVSLSDEFIENQQIDDQTLLTFSMTDTGQKPPEPEQEKEEKKEEKEIENQKENKSIESKEKDKEKTKKGEKKEEKEEKKPLDLTLELVDSQGNSARLPLSYFSTLHPPLKVKYTNWSLMESSYKKPSEPVLETFEFPLKAFQEVNPTFEPGKLSKIIFIFDKNEQGVIYLDEIGFRTDI